MKREHQPSFLGVEAGGTRTVALVADAAGNLLRRHESGPANLKLLADKQLIWHFRDLARALPRPDAIGLGMAGARTPEDHARLRLVLQKVWGDLPCHATSDLDTALAAAGDAEGFAAQVLILSGTGSCCSGRRRGGKTARSGGWGHVLGDAGSGFDIAMQALRLCVAEFDRTRRWPKLGQSLLRTLLLNEPNDLVAWAHSAPKHEVASLAEEVFAAWHQGDSLATGIVRKAAQALAGDGLICARQLGGATGRVRFVFAGSVLLRQPKFAALVRARLTKARPRSVAIGLPREGAWGAIALAKLAHGLRHDGAPARRPAGSAPGPAPGREVLPATIRLSPTEERHPRSLRLDKLGVREAVRLMLAEDRKIPGALVRVEPQITRAVALIVHALRHGGRLFYVGAGTSGRLGVLDASECPPTFRTPPDLVQGIMAGGAPALWRSVEGAEDDYSAGARAVEFRGVTRKDIVVGIAASGRTPFVWGALNAARRRRARTVLICFNPHLRFKAGTKPDVVIAPRIGPEILTGSTRLKAGTATKIILNLFTTLSQVRLGKVKSNLMVDLNPSNAKLRDRSVRIVGQLANASASAAQTALADAGWVVKAALARLA